MVNISFKPVQALQRGLALLEVISRRRDGAVLKELAEEIGCSSAAAFHLVHTLVEGGYVRRQEAPVRYVLGDGLLRLVENLRNDRFYAVVHAGMRRLAESLPGADIFLSEYLGGSIVVRSHLPGSAPNQLRQGDRQILPPYASAGSLVHLAFFPPDLVEEFHTRYAFATYGLPFWKSRKAFEAAVQSLRENGVFLMPEDSPRTLKLAVPILLPGGRLAAALTIQWNQKDSRSLARKRSQLRSAALREAAAITQHLSP